MSPEKIIGVVHGASALLLGSEGVGEEPIELEPSRAIVSIIGRK